MMPIRVTNFLGVAAMIASCTRGPNDRDLAIDFLISPDINLRSAVLRPLSAKPASEITGERLHDLRQLLSRCLVVDSRALAVLPPLAEWSHAGHLRLQASERACFIDVLQHGPYFILRVMDASSPSSSSFVYLDSDGKIAAYLYGTRLSE